MIFLASEPTERLFPSYFGRISPRSDVIWRANFHFPNLGSAGPHHTGTTRFIPQQQIKGLFRTERVLCPFLGEFELVWENRNG